MCCSYAEWQPTVTYSLGWWASVEAVSLVLNCKITDSEMAGTSLAFMTRSDSIPYIVCYLGHFSEDFQFIHFIAAVAHSENNHEW